MKHLAQFSVGTTLKSGSIFGRRQQVDYAGDPCSLTEATRRALNLPAGTALQPSPHWTFNGKTVKEIYEAFHESSEDE